MAQSPAWVGMQSVSDEIARVTLALKAGTKTQTEVLEDLLRLGRECLLWAQLARAEGDGSLCDSLIWRGAMITEMIETVVKARRR